MAAKSDYIFLMDKIKNLNSGRMSEWKEKEEELELELRGKKHCSERNRKKVHVPDNDNSGLSQAKDAATSLGKPSG